VRSLECAAGGPRTLEWKPQNARRCDSFKGGSPVMKNIIPSYRSKFSVVKTTSSVNVKFKNSTDPLQYIQWGPNEVVTVAGWLSEVDSASRSIPYARPDRRAKPPRASQGIVHPGLWATAANVFALTASMLRGLMLVMNRAASVCAACRVIEFRTNGYHCDYRQSPKTCKSLTLPPRLCSQRHERQRAPRRTAAFVSTLLPIRATSWRLANVAWLVASPRTSSVGAQ
jgi:hypothetical protein